MELNSYFNDMLVEIRPPQDLLDECVEAHTHLRQTLLKDPELKDVVVTTFLQGSYRRSTLIRPSEGSKPDVDVVLVTNLNPGDWTPAQVQERFCGILDKYERYRGKYERQGRSIGLSQGRVKLDLVVTASPSEALRKAFVSDAFGAAFSVETNPDWSFTDALPSRMPEWKAEPLLIPDRDADKWEQTDPISQIEWTHDKNRRTNGHYVNVVKVFKWWWTRHSSGERGLPKGYLVERLVGLHCPDDIESVAEGFTIALEGIRDAYETNVAYGTTPFVPDVGLPHNDVFKRVSPEHFKAFYDAVKAGATKARTALDDPNATSSAKRWATLFGDVFPVPSEGVEGSSSGNAMSFTRPSRPAVPGPARFA